MKAKTVSIPVISCPVCDVPMKHYEGSQRLYKYVCGTPSCKVRELMLVIKDD
jgi:hypothetical protein